MTKLCAGPCGQDLDVDAFAPDAHRRDGRHPYCRPCRTLMSMRARKRLVLGTAPWVDAGPVRDHVHLLLVAGMSRHQIAELAGVHRTSIRNLMVGQPPRQGPAKRLRVDTAAALLDVPAAPGALAPVPAGLSRRAGAHIDPLGTERRLQALLANGWPGGVLAGRLGCTTRNLQIRGGRRVTSSTASAVRNLYADLCDTPGPSRRAGTYWRGRGYLTPMWWDEDTIDDPMASPDGLQEYDDRGLLLVDHAAHRDDRVGWLHDHGHDVASIARLLGITTKLTRRSLAKHRAVA